MEMRASSHEVKSVGLILARKLSVILDRAQARAGIQSNISALRPLDPGLSATPSAQDDGAGVG